MLLDRREHFAKGAERMRADRFKREGAGEPHHPGLLVEMAKWFDQK
jgi:hypothetical protein